MAVPIADLVVVGEVGATRRYEPQSAAAPAPVRYQRSKTTSEIEAVTLNGAGAVRAMTEIEGVHPGIVGDDARAC